MRPLHASMAAALAILLGVAACAGPRSGTVYNSTFTAGYDPFSLRAAMSRAPLLVETFGTPEEGRSQADVGRATALALRQFGPAWLPRNYTDSPADAGNGRYRLRVAYALPRSFDRQLLCAATMDDAVAAARGAGDTASRRSVAGLCRGETMLGIAEGAPAETAIDGDSFPRFVGLLGREVMPRRNPVLDDDCIFRFCD